MAANTKARKAASGAASGKATAKARGSSGTSGAARSSEPPALRRLDGTFPEWRYVPKHSAREWLGVTAMSLGAVLLGAGAYAWIGVEAGSTTGDYAPWLAAFGLLCFVAYLLLGRGQVSPLRVGPLGVATEEEAGKIVRTPWYALTRLTLEGGALRLEGKPAPLPVSLELHGKAAAHILGDALRRIPRRVAVDEDGVARVGEPDKTAALRVEIEPPQVTSLRCRASGQPLTFEEDVRMCSRCGVLYHRSAVPRRCLECDRKLPGE